MTNAAVQVRTWDSERPAPVLTAQGVCAHTHSAYPTTFLQGQTFLNIKSENQSACTDPAAELCSRFSGLLACSQRSPGRVRLPGLPTAASTLDAEAWCRADITAPSPAQHADQ